jgi:hypothetical protein
MTGTNNNDKWEYFTMDSFGHEIEYQVCEYCLDKRSVQLWEFAEEDRDIGAGRISLSTYHRYDRDKFEKIIRVRWF